MRIGSRVSRLCAAGVAVVAAVVSGCGGGGGSSLPKVAAVVNGVHITSADIVNLAKIYQQSPAGMGEKFAQVLQDTLSYRIKLTFVDQMAKEVGVSIDPHTENKAEINTQLLNPKDYQGMGFRPQDYVAAQRAGALSDQIAQKLFPNVVVTDQEVASEFQQEQSVLGSSWKENISLAVFSDQNAAAQIAQLLQRGQAFQQAAAQLGGQVNTAEINPLAPLPSQLLDAFSTLKTDQLTPVVDMGNGLWARGIVNSREDLPALTIAMVKPDLVAKLQSQKRQNLFNDWFDGRFKAAHITVSKYFGHWDPDSQAVV